MDRVTTAAEVLGAACIAVALWAVAWPLGLASVGVFLLLFGYLAGDR